MTELVVRDVTVRSVVVPLGRPLATKVGDFSRWPLLLIDVTTEQGITGRGYLAPYLSRAAAAVRTVLEDMGAALRGQPASPAAAYANARGWLGLAGYQGLALAAVAGLDIALWDVLAQAARLPLAVLLGGSLAPVPAYNSNGLGLIPPERAAEEALELLAEGGFTALKVRVGRDRAADDIAAVRRVRAAVGDEVTLVADYNQGLSLGEALDRCRALDGEGLSWIEEPLRYDDLDGHARLAADLATPVMLGENFYGPRAMYDAIRSRACDLVMPDLMRIGGVTGWLRAARDRRRDRPADVLAPVPRGLRAPAPGHPDRAVAGVAGLGPSRAGPPLRGPDWPAAPARRPRQRPGMGRGSRGPLPGGLRLVLFFHGPDDRAEQGGELVLLPSGRGWR